MLTHLDIELVNCLCYMNWTDELRVERGDVIYHAIVKARCLGNETGIDGEIPTLAQYLEENCYPDNDCQGEKVEQRYFNLV